MMNKAGNLLLNLSLLFKTFRSIRNIHRLFLDCAGLATQAYPLRIYGGPTIWIRPGTTDRGIVKEVFLLEHYRPALEGLKPGQVVLDIGAQIGVFSAYVAQKCPGAIVHSFEPMSENYQFLQRNIAANAFANVTPHRLAVAGAGGQVKLFLSNENTGMHSICRPSARFEEVQAIGINELFEQHHIDQVRIMKLDCEGAEHAILQNATDATLRRIGAAVMEYHDPRRVDELTSRLEQAGFKVNLAARDALLFATRRH